MSSILQVCGKCRGTFRLVVKATGESPATPGPFAAYVKERYGAVKGQVRGNYFFKNYFISQSRFIIYLEKKSIQTFIIRWYIISMYYIAAAMYCIATSRSATAKSRERTICILFIHEIFFWTFWRHYNLI